MNATSWQRVTAAPTPERVRECEPVLAAMRTYAMTHIEPIRGWLHGGPKAAVWSLLDGQTMDGVSGDVMEIGVFEGRTFGLLMASLAGGERATAVDPFGSDQRRNAFLSNMRNLGIDNTRMRRWDMSSEEFWATPECAALAGRVRFLSLDGGHEYDDVTVDLKISQDVISTAGIVAFDDFF
jgi:hypothetical protein